MNLEKAKLIAHEKRREARAEEFKPWDEIIMKQIPGNSLQNAESERKKIREKYAELQIEMNNAITVEELKALIP